jgi:hypothetical protein
MKQPEYTEGPEALENCEQCASDSTGSEAEIGSVTLTVRFRRAWKNVNFSACEFVREIVLEGSEIRRKRSAKQPDYNCISCVFGDTS